LQNFFKNLLQKINIEIKQIMKITQIIVIFL